MDDLLNVSFTDEDVNPRNTEIGNDVAADDEMQEGTEGEHGNSMVSYDIYYYKSAMIHYYTYIVQAYNGSCIYAFSWTI